MIGRVLAACALLAFAPPAAAKAKKKKKKPAPDPTAAALAASAEKIQECGLRAIPDGGAVTIDTRVTVSGGGQLLDLRVTVEPAGAASEQARSCVELVLRAVTWPPRRDPLVTIARTWTISAAK